MRVYRFRRGEKPRFGLAPLLPIMGVSFIVGACGGGNAKTTYRATDIDATPGAVQQLNFDQSSDLPPGITVFSGEWTVRAEEGAPSAPNALCQTAKATFPALSIDDTVYEDVRLSARFKSISGKEDRAGGLIFRVQDKDNYYILRANALEGNVNLYRYIGGSRSELMGASVALSSGEWHELRIETNDETLRGYFDDDLVVEVADDTFHAGKVGLWTKSDSVTCFDDVEARAP